MSTSSQPCNSTALAPRSFRFPYMTYLLRVSTPMAGVAQRPKSRFGHFLALTVPSAVGLVTHVPLRLYPGEKSSLQRTATRRHRTQLYEILGSFEQFFRKVTYFAKKRGTPCTARHSRFMPEKSRKLELVVDTKKRLVYTVIRLKLENFRKVCYFAKIFVPFSDTKKDAERRPFYVIPFRNPIPSTALRL
mgnify:CR=1 FL=1